MSLLKSLPARPSFESLRKEAKRLARDIAAGNSDAITRARDQLPDAALPLSLRDSQLVLAREYGYPGWRDLTAEVHKRLGRGLEWAAARARRIIHDNDVEALRQLLAEYPDLLSWRDETHAGGLLGMATSSYGDSSDAERERNFTRAACAELLLDAGAVVLPVVCDELAGSRVRGLLRVFANRGLLPRTLKFFVALNDLGAVRAHLAADGDDIDELSVAFWCACRFEHQDAASLILDRLCALDSRLGARIDGGSGRAAFVEYIMEKDALAFVDATPSGLWQGLVMYRAMRAIEDEDLGRFIDGLRHEPELLGDSHVGFQIGIIERATLSNRGAFITAFHELNPALLRQQPRPHTQAFEFAFTYLHTDLVSLIARFWPLPDDLPHAAGMGDIGRVKRWFDASGQPALGDIDKHFPRSSPAARTHGSSWDAAPLQKVLDTALAWSVINNHFEVAEFLLAHGADINTRWATHEPASILHELVFHENYPAMQFLIDRGIDLTIEDYRWRGTPQGWAYHAKKDEKMSRWLASFERGQ